MPHRLNSLLLVFLFIAKMSIGQDLPHKTSYAKPPKPVRGAIHFVFEPNLGYVYSTGTKNDIDQNYFSIVHSVRVGIQLYQKKEKPYFLRIQFFQPGLFFNLKHDVIPFMGSPGLGFGRRFPLGDSFSFEPSLTANACFKVEDSYLSNDPKTVPVILGKAKFNFNQFFVDLDASYLPYYRNSSYFFNNFYIGLGIGFYGVIRKYNPR